MRLAIGMRTFMKPETAAAHIIKHGLDATDVKVLQDGQLSEPELWQIEEVQAHVRDQND